MTLMQKWIEKAVRHVWFVLGVVLPVLLSALYFTTVASDEYESESRFVVKAPHQRASQVSNFANLIQATGLSAGQEQADQVMDFVRSRSALQKLNAEVPLKQIYGADQIDFMSAYPLPWQDDAFEDLY